MIHRTFRGPWDRCSIRGCPKKTASELKEKDPNLRFCSGHLPSNVLKFKEIARRQHRCCTSKMTCEVPPLIIFCRSSKDNLGICSLALRKKCLSNWTTMMGLRCSRLPRKAKPKPLPYVFLIKRNVFLGEPNYLTPKMQWVEQRSKAKRLTTEYKKRRWLEEIRKTHPLAFAVRLFPKRVRKNRQLTEVDEYLDNRIANQDRLEIVLETAVKNGFLTKYEVGDRVVVWGQKAGVVAVMNVLRKMVYA